MRHPRLLLMIYRKIRPHQRPIPAWNAAILRGLHRGLLIGFPLVAVPGRGRLGGTSISAGQSTLSQVAARVVSRIAGSSRRTTIGFIPPGMAGIRRSRL